MPPRRARQPAAAEAPAANQDVGLDEVLGKESPSVAETYSDFDPEANAKKPKAAAARPKTSRKRPATADVTDKGVDSVDGLDGKDDATMGPPPPQEQRKRPAASTARTRTSGSSSEATISAEALKNLQDPDKNILHRVLSGQLDMLSDDDKSALKRNLMELQAGPSGFRVASLCSGSNVAFLSTITLALLVTGNADFVSNLFDTEKCPEKTKWLTKVMHKNFGSGCIFKNMEEMNLVSAQCSVHGRVCKIPSGHAAGPLLGSCGFSCKDLSRANPKSSSFKHGVKNKDGNTARTLWGCQEYCEHHQPPIMVLENVPQFLSSQSSNKEEFDKMWKSVGYVTGHTIIDAKSWVPQRRKRVYFILLNIRIFGISEEVGHNIIKNMLKVAESLSFKVPIGLADILKGEKHYQSRKELAELQKVCSKRSGHQDDAAEWPAQHLAEMSKKGVTYSSLNSFHLNSNSWFQTLTDREKLVAMYNMAVNPMCKTIDISQNINRSPSSSTTGGEAGGESTDVCSTLLTGSHIWLTEAERIMTGWEACLLQCIPVDALPGASLIGRRGLVALAGDAFCGAAFGSILIGILVHLPAIADEPAQYEDADTALLKQLVWIDS